MLVSTKQKVDGVITLDMVNGRFVAIQTKAVIVADGGFEGIFNGTGIGFGMDLPFNPAYRLETWNLSVKHLLE